MNHYLAYLRFQHTAARRRLAGQDFDNSRYECFNTQPPEGGWFNSKSKPFKTNCFNTQPPEGGWQGRLVINAFYTLFQHTAARRRLVWLVFAKAFKGTVSTHSRPKAAGAHEIGSLANLSLFQHTAARRRLGRQ